MPAPQPEVSLRREGNSEKRSQTVSSAAPLISTALIASAIVGFFIRNYWGLKHPLDGQSRDPQRLSA
jgi:hypothetical protein